MKRRCSRSSHVLRIPPVGGTLASLRTHRLSHCCHCGYDRKPVNPFEAMRTTFRSRRNDEATPTPSLRGGTTKQPPPRHCEEERRSNLKCERAPRYSQPPPLL